MADNLEAFAIEMKKLTNWNLTILAGGEDPTTKKLRTIAYHHGKDKRGQIFSVAYPEFYQNVLTPFREFLENFERKFY